MITGHTLDTSGNFQETVSEEGVNTLRVAAPTANKDQLMVYVKFDRKSEGGHARLKFEMSDPKIMGGAPFQMSQLDGTNVAPVVIDIVQSGNYRVPVPTGVNESTAFINAEILDGDAAQDSLEFWATLNSYQPVSGMLV